MRVTPTTCGWVDVMEQSWYTMHKVLTPIQVGAFLSVPNPFSPARLTLEHAQSAHAHLGAPSLGQTPAVARG